MGSYASKKHGSSSSLQLHVPKYDLNHFGVITVLFNPIKYRSRYESYHKFDEHMTRSGVTLLTVECIFPESEILGLAKQKFEITRESDPRHLQIAAPSVLWLKENLINIAAKRLPAYVEYIAWLDADIEFERLDWAHMAIYQLQQFPIVQLFELSSFLGPSGKSQILRQDYSFAYAIRHGHRIDPRRSSECFVHPGYAWAMRRVTFEAMGGLIDFSILGSGDIHFAYALINRIEETIPDSAHEDYRSLAKIWGQRVAQLAGNGTSVGFIPVNIWHHWHGNRVDRGYFDRWSTLELCNFSPLKDLEKNNATGLIRLTNYRRLGEKEAAQRSESIEKIIISYFRSRNEDSLKKPIPAINLTMASSKPRILSNDVVRPSNPLEQFSRQSWTVDINRTLDGSEWNHAQDERSVPRTIGTNSLSAEMLNDSFFHPSIRDTNPRRNRHKDFLGQGIYYDDGNGNNYLESPGEISF
ncbi:unnamed protein product [Rotaria socialis]|uniref:Uncharacterized protein n=1 Tax=Rotaria socialis TaxID=392032 RepID=A0A818IMR2_9BILA|nr:unnamed protein product [Rotaria socialis]CAF3594559.1 unnamed protein product [Rotaria socialis]CAF4242436.1 unnamed protein product [Rotaria socialis]CAF4828785.1 unnamed protein product [Rotaria socialis]